MELRTPWAALVALVLWCAPAQAEWVDTVVDAALGVVWTDNLNQSAFDADREADFGVLPQLSLGRFYQAADHTRLRLTVDVASDFYAEFDKLNSFTVGPRFVARHKFGTGPRLPWVRLDAGGGYKKTRVDMRDSALYDLGLRVGRRFAARWDGSVGFRHSWRDGGAGESPDPATPTDVFDMRHWTANGVVNVLLTAQALASVSYTYFKGEFDSACTPGNIGTVLANETLGAFAFDEVFGGCIYRLDGVANLIDVNLGYALGRHAAFNAGGGYRKGKAEVLEYETSVVRLSFNYSR